MLHHYTAIAAITCLIAGSSAFGVISTFDSDLDGWTRTGDTTFFGQASPGGNPDGYMRIVDAATGAIIHVKAPAKFLGDQSGYNGGALSFDFRVFTGSTSLLTNWGTVTITGSSGSASLDLGSPPGDAWTTYSTPMTAAAWGKSELEWTSLLSDITEIDLYAEAINGGETLGMDNFQITPEPASAALLAWGGLAAMRRRR